MLPAASSVLRALALAFFAAALLLAMPEMAEIAGKRIHQAVSMLGEDSGQARRRFLGPAYVAAVDEVRRAIPPDGEYLLVDGGFERQGAALFLRYELAPRRARFVGRLTEVKDPSRWAASLPQGPRWVVVAYPRRPAVLVDRDDFPLWVEGAIGRR
ncbi:MAG: hypothetical protein QOF89_2867 [Acidobacteriota bacterium]|nr:hypothetical protein [Acidobacteriota bacterium]